MRFGDPGFELPDDLRALLSTDPAERAEAAAAFTRVGEAPLPGADVSPATEAAAAFARTGELPLDLFAVGGALRPLPGATLDQRFSRATTCAGEAAIPSTMATRSSIRPTASPRRRPAMTSSPSSRTPSGWPAWAVSHETAHRRRHG